MYLPWHATMMLAIEASEVIALRLSKLASGEDVADEAVLMVSEKIDAALEAGVSLLTGAPPDAIVARYREHVAANSSRLSAA